MLMIFYQDDNQDTLSFGHAIQGNLNMIRSLTTQNFNACTLKASERFTPVLPHNFEADMFATLNGWTQVCHRSCKLS